MADTPATPLYATFPRRVHALTIDTLVYAAFIVVFFVIAPAGQFADAFRILLSILFWGFLLLYEPVLIAKTGATLGHRLLNLRIVDQKTGENIGFPRALLRFLLKFILGIFSFLTMIFTKRHQALHDLATASAVRIHNPEKALPHHYVEERK